MAVDRGSSLSGIFYTLLIIIPACCHAITQGEFLVAHSPSYMRYLTDAKPILTSEIPDLINSALGFNIQHDEPVLLTQSVTDNLQRFTEKPTIVDFSVDSTFFDVRSHHPELFAKLPATFGDVREAILRGKSPTVHLADIGHFDLDSDSNLLFLGEMYIIGEIVKALEVNADAIVDTSPDFYHFTLSGLAQVVERYGEESTQANVARTILANVLNTVTSSLRRLYEDDLLVHVVSLPRATAALVRKSRSLMSASAPPAKPAEVVGGLATAYDENYAVAFNIILWLMVVMGVAVAAVSYSIWFMDPGRDSIIYRMTSQRLKSD